MTLLAMWLSPKHHIQIEPLNEISCDSDTDLSDLCIVSILQTKPYPELSLECGGVNCPSGCTFLVVEALRVLHWTAVFAVLLVCVWVAYPTLDDELADRTLMRWRLCRRALVLAEGCALHVVGLTLGSCCCFVFGGRRLLWLFVFFVTLDFGWIECFAFCNVFVCIIGT